MPQQDLELLAGERAMAFPRLVLRCWQRTSLFIKGDGRSARRVEGGVRLSRGGAVACKNQRQAIFPPARVLDPRLHCGHRDSFNEIEERSPVISAPRVRGKDKNSDGRCGDAKSGSAPPQLTSGSAVLPGVPKTQAPVSPIDHKQR